MYDQENQQLKNKPTAEGVQSFPRRRVAVAQQGDAEAQYELAHYLEIDKGMSQAAFPWYLRAAEQGQHLAQERLDALRNELLESDKITVASPKLCIGSSEDDEYLQTLEDLFEVNANDYSSISVADLLLSERAFNCLSGCGCNTVRDLLLMTKSDLMMIKNLGLSTVDEIKDKLQSYIEIAENGTVSSGTNPSYWINLNSTDPFSELLEVKNQDDLLELVCDLNLSRRAENCLINGLNGCLTVGDLFAYSPAELLKVKNSGKKTVREICDCLALRFPSKIITSPTIEPKLTVAQLMNVWEKIASDFKEHLVAPFVFAYFHSYKIHVINSSPLKHVPRDVIFSNWVKESFLERLSIKGRDEVYKFLTWLQVDIRKESYEFLLGAIKDNYREILVRRATTNATLQTIADEQHVTRELIRQKETKAVKQLLNLMSQQKNDALLYVRAINNGKDTLSRDCVEATLGKDLTACIFYVMKVGNKNTKLEAIIKEFAYRFDKSLDSIVVGKSESMVHEQVKNFVDSLPEIIEKAELENLIEAKAQEIGAARDSFYTLINDQFHEEGPLMSRSKLSKGEKEIYVLEKYYTVDNGYQAYEPKEIEKFKKHLRDIFGLNLSQDSDHAIQAIMAKRAVLCDRGTYCAKSDSMISKNLFADIKDYIDNLECIAFEVQYLYDVFAEKLRGEGINNKYYLYGILQTKLGDQLNARKFYIFRDNKQKTDIYEAVRNIIRDSDVPVLKEDIAKQILGITGITMAKSTEIPEVVNLFGRYILGKKLSISDAEEECIQAILDREIGKESKCSSGTLYEAVVSDGRLQSFLQRNFIEKQFDLLSVLAYLFKNQYSFDRAFVGASDSETKTNSRMVREMVGQRKILKIDELWGFARDHNLYIENEIDYLESFSETHLVVNENLLVAIDYLGIDEFIAKGIEDKLLQQINEAVPIIASKFKSLIGLSEDWDEWFIYSIIGKWGKRLIVKYSRPSFKEGIPIIGLQDADFSKFMGKSRDDIMEGFNKNRMPVSTDDNTVKHSSKNSSVATILDEIKKALQTASKENVFNSLLCDAEQGDADAQYGVGFCYDNGCGVEYDSTKSFEWYLKAAKQGHKAAQSKVAKCYAYGWGTLKDTIKATEWKEIAAGRRDLPSNPVDDLIDSCEFIDFANIGNLSYTQPRELRYFAEKYNCKKWANLYVGILKLLYRDYKDIFMSKINTLKLRSKDVILVSARKKATLRRALLIDDKIYAEGNFSAKDIVLNIKAFLDLCGVSYDNVGISYIKKGSESPKVEPSKAEPPKAEPPKAESPKLNKEQLNAFNLMKSGRNVHLYGEAGTGKSFVLKQFISSLSGSELEHTIVAAPTGIAAINVGGATLHRIFKIPIEPLSPEKPFQIPSTLYCVKRIIIDEYSMMRFDVFGYVSRIILAVEKKLGHKIQVIVVGDALQLPPVIKNEDFETLKEVWKDTISDIGNGFPFVHPNWEKFNFVNCRLNKIVRQSGDVELIENENKARKGDSSCLKWFVENTAQDFDEDALHICPHNKEVDWINNAKCEQFTNKVRFEAEIEGIVSETDKMTKDVLELAPGMRVMTVINASDIDEYQNGSMGTITRVGQNGRTVEIRFDNGNVSEIGRHTWEICNYAAVPGTHRVKKDIIGKFRQIPLKIAYAVTIHKSQGQTYDKVIIHPACFAAGQLYVALSRCRTRNGIFIDGGHIRPEWLMVCIDALQFYERIEQKLVNDTEKKPVSTIVPGPSVPKPSVSIFSGPNQQQQEAIDCTEGPLLIIAGPGTGKTFTLVSRAINMILNKHVEPKEILMTTFTEKAAKEMMTRITNEMAKHPELGMVNVNEMYIGTFHSICLRIIKENIEYTSLKNNYRVLDGFDQQYLIYRNVHAFKTISGYTETIGKNGKGKDRSTWDQASDICGYVNNLTEEMVDIDALHKSNDPELILLAEMYTQYQNILVTNNALDFSLIQSMCYRLLTEHPEVLAKIKEQVKYLMVDEYQDTNYIQEQLAFLLAGERQNLCVVGDDDQGLYRFRGATIRNILEFPKKFKDGQCKQINLVENYRSNPQIVNFYNNWMAQLPEEGDHKFSFKNFRYPKKIVAKKNSTVSPAVFRITAGKDDVDGWHMAICEFINDLRSSGKVTNLNQIAFLFSSVKSILSTELAKFLEDNGIPVYSPRSGMFFEREEIKLSMGCLVALFPLYSEKFMGDKSLEENVNKDVIGYFRGCYQLFKIYVRERGTPELKRWIMKNVEAHRDLKKVTNYAFSALFYQMLQFEPFKSIVSSNLMDGLATDLRPVRNLATLTKLISKYEEIYNVSVFSKEKIEGIVERFFNRYFGLLYKEGMAEYEDESEYAPSGCVSFMTIHQAKGLEFPVVFVASLYDRPKDKGGLPILEKVEANFYHRKPFEPLEKIRYFDFWRKYYTAFSRPQNILILSCYERRKSWPMPSWPFSNKIWELSEYNADEHTLADIELEQVKDVNLKDTYSFTSQIAVYDTCPTQYKFFKELEFTPVRDATVIFGTLVHATIEDIHKAVLRNETKNITEATIKGWFDTNYDAIKRSTHSPLSDSALESAFAHVMRYVESDQTQWSRVRAAEVDVSYSADDYIIGGKIDLIRGQDENTVEIVDFKSSKKPDLLGEKDTMDRYRRQLHLYAYLVEKNMGVKVSKMMLYFTGETNSVPSVIYPYTKTAVEGTVAAFRGTVEKIKKKDFSGQCKSLKTCRECDFRFFCGRN